MDRDEELAFISSRTFEEGRTGRSRKCEGAGERVRGMAMMTMGRDSGR